MACSTALDRKTGALKWKYDTAQTYTGANGVDGNGGSFDAASIIATHGLLIVNSPVACSARPRAM